MNKSRHWAVAAAIVLSLSLCVTLIAQAQQPPVRQASTQATAGPRLALLDVSRVFNNHTRFNAERERIRNEMTQTDAQMKQERDAIIKLTEDLRAQYRPGTPDYKTLEETITKRKADFAVNGELQKNKFVKRQAELFNSTYQEILQATDYFCKQHAIDMVVNHFSEPVDVEQPNSVREYINRQVVWYDPGLDITNDILKDLNRTPVPPAANRNAAPARQGVSFPK